MKFLAKLLPAIFYFLIIFSFEEGRNFSANLSSDVWRVAKLAVLLFSVILAFSSKKSRREFIFAVKSERLLIGYLLLSSLLIPFAADDAYSLQKLSVFTLQFFGLLAILSLSYAHLYEKDKFPSLFKASVPLAISVLVLSVTVGSEGRQYFGGIIAANTTAIMMGIALIVGFWIIKCSRRRLINIVSLVLVAAAFIVLESRSTFVVIFAAYIFAHGLRHVKTGSGHLITLLTVTLVLLLFGGMFLPDILNMMSRKEGMEDIYTLSNRVIIWQKIFDDLDVHAVLFGHGFASVTSTRSIEMDWVEVGNAHNTYLHLLSTGGALSLGLFVAYILLLFKKVYRYVAINMEGKVKAWVFSFVIMMSMTETIIGLRVTPALVALVVLNIGFSKLESERRKQMVYVR